MTAKELMKQCEAEEKELKFREFSSEMAFHIAGSMAFKDAMAKAAPALDVYKRQDGGTSSIVCRSSGRV